MERALIKAGYDVRVEFLDADWYDSRSDGDPLDRRKTYMVYFAGECVTSGPKFARLYGYERMSLIFELELRKRVLGLF